MALIAVLLALAVAAGALVAARRTTHAGARHASLVVLGASTAIATWLLAATVARHPQSSVQYWTPDGSARTELHVPDADLGYMPRPGAQVRAVRRIDATTAFDVLYTIGDDGLRVTPGDPAGPTVVFFGCSYTFGHGVGDDDTLPAHLSAALGGTAHVESRAAPGYGPHQMLRALETGRAAIPPGTRVFYQALGDHVRRAAGKAPWDEAGPRYVLDGDGVRYTGPLHAALLRPLRRAAAQLVKYGILPARVFGAGVDDDERELFVRIVAASARRVRDAGGRFTVILWDDDPEAMALGDRLDARGLEVWRMSALLPSVDLGKLQIAGDEHPAPELYHQLAIALAARLTGTEPMHGLMAHASR